MLSSLSFSGSESASSGWLSGGGEGDAVSVSVSGVGKKAVGMTRW
jgi:hypothetical protein